MEKEIKIKIADVYHKMPMGRYYPTDGDWTGDRFRQQYLSPIFDNYEKIIIDLDDLYGCPSSFREEAFAGLAREKGIDEVLDKLEFSTIDFPFLIDKIKGEIRKAKDTASPFS